MKKITQYEFSRYFARHKNSEYMVTCRGKVVGRWIPDGIDLSISDVLSDKATSDKENKKTSDERGGRSLAEIRRLIK